MASKYGTNMPICYIYRNKFQFPIIFFKDYRGKYYNSINFLNALQKKKEVFFQRHTLDIHVHKDILGLNVMFKTFKYYNYLTCEVFRFYLEFKALMSSLDIVITYLNLLKIILMDDMHLFDKIEYHFYQKKIVEHKSYD